MATSESKEFYHRFVQLVRDNYAPEKVQGMVKWWVFQVNLCTLDGEFGAMMEVNLVNDGPVTLQLDSRKFVYVEEKEQSPTSVTPSPKPKKQD